MSRSSGALLAVSLVLALLAAACGVPTSTGVRVDGPPEDPGVRGSAGEGEPPPPGPDDAGSPGELVEYFLRAAAGDPEHAADELRDFVHPSEADGWEPEEPVWVVRMPDDEPLLTRGDPNKFDVTVQKIGVLNDGVVEPLSTAAEPEVVSIYVKTERSGDDDELRPGEERYRIVDPPDEILLADQALDIHFQARSIYFWDINRNKLVPDLRWLPNSIPRFERSQMALNWLFHGPSPRLSAAVADLPDGLELDGNLIPTDDNLVVPLTATDDDDYDRHALASQLWWTLRPDLDGGIEVTVVINDQEFALSGDYGPSNPVPEEVTTSFAIVGGTIERYLPLDAALPQVLEREAFNQGIARAALSRNGRLAAVVRQQEDGRLRLDLAGPDGVVETRLTAQAMSRPIWLNNPAGTGLVAADGALRRFSTGERSVARLDLSPLEQITAIAAAPDGRRLALVADGQLYVALMVRTDEGIQQIRQPQPIPTTATDLAGVAFTRENRLAVIGAGEEQQELFELTVDGALEQRLAGLGSPNNISNVVAFPVHPAAEDRDISIMYESDGRTWGYTRQEPAEVTAADLLDEPPEDTDPRAPFFLD